MKNEGTVAGYASIEKPWLKYYSQEQLNKRLPQKKIFDYVWESNCEGLDREAISYFDRIFTYREIFDGIEMAAKAFHSIGICQGDVVCMVSVTLPEIIYSLYGLNRLGAISNMIDPRTSEDGIRFYISETNTKVIVVLEDVLEKVLKAIEGTSVNYVISVSPADSLSFPKKQLYKIFKCPYRKRFQKITLWKDFIKQGEHEVISDTPYQKDQCCVIVHTGGTTGSPKGVMLSNDNLNCSTFQCINSSLITEKSNIWINIMPPFIAYGVGLGLHLPLSVGMKIILIPRFDPEKLDLLILKYKPSHIAGVPSHFEHLITQAPDIPGLIS